MSRRVDIGGVQVNCVGLAGMLELVTDWIAGSSRRRIFYANAHSLNIANGDADYRAILNQADLVYADGAAVVWAARLLSGCRMQRATGADWIYDLCRLAEAQGWRLYILAGKPGVAKTARQNLLQQFPRLHVVGAVDGFFTEMSETQVLRDIAQAAPQILLVGMGTPRQEKWIVAQHDTIKVPICWGVGALFDYVAGLEPRAPAWMRRLALEWCWRLMVDPVGKWRRYLLGNPRFVYRVVRQKLRSRF